MSMFNPRIKEVSQMFSQVFDKHAEEIDVATLDWVYLRDDTGNIMQIVPILNVVFKG